MLELKTTKKLEKHAAKIYTYFQMSFGLLAWIVKLRIKKRYIRDWSFLLLIKVDREVKQFKLYMIHLIMQRTISVRCLNVKAPHVAIYCVF